VCDVSSIIPNTESDFSIRCSPISNLQIDMRVSLLEDVGIKRVYGIPRSIAMRLVFIFIILVDSVPVFSLSAL